MPVRTIPKNYLVTTGVFASSKNDRMCGFEGTLEPDLMAIAEFSKVVKCFEEQPVRIDYVDDKRLARRYTPDLLVTFHDEIVVKYNLCPLLIEVKPRKYLAKNRAELAPKFRAAAAFSREQGKKFRVFTETKIRTPYLYNAKFLIPFRRFPIDLERREKLLELMKRMGESDPQTILLAASNDKEQKAFLLTTLWQLLDSLEIRTDLTKPITMRSRIWLSSSEMEGEILCPFFLK